MTLDSVIKNTAGGTSTITINGGAYVSGSGARYFLAGDNQNFEDRNKIIMDFQTSLGVMYFDDGVYPKVELSTGVTATADYIAPTSNIHGAAKFYDVNIGCTWNSGSGTIRDNIKKRFEIENTDTFTIASTLFDTGYSTWSIDTTSTVTIPTDGDIYGNSSIFNVRWYNLIIKNTGNQNKLANISLRRNLVVNSLTVEEGATLRGYATQSIDGGNGGTCTITSTTRPNIKGAWNFKQVADGVYSSILDEAYSITPSHGTAGKMQFSFGGGAFYSHSKMQILIEDYRGDWEDVPKPVLSICDGAYIKSSFYEFCQSYSLASGGSGANSSIWVDDSTPNVLYYTDSAGTHHNLLAGGGGSSADEKVKISAVDPTTDYLGNKIVSGTNTAVAINVDPVTLNQTLTVNATDTKVGATASDGTPSNLTDKLLAGTNITFATATHPTLGDQITINSAGGGGGVDEKVKISSADTTPNFLENKITAGANITLTKQNAGANETIEISSTGGGGGGGEVVEYVVDNTTININTTIAVLYSNTPCTATSAIYGTWGYNFSSAVTYDYTTYTGLVDLPVPTVGKKLSLVLRPMATGVNTLGKRPTVVGWGGLQFTCTGSSSPIRFIGHDLMLQSGIGVSRMGETFVLCEPELRRWAAANMGSKFLSGNPDIGQVVIDLVGVPAPPEGFSHTWQPTGNGYWDNDDPEPDPTDPTSQTGFGTQVIDENAPAVWQIATNNEMIFDASKNSVDDLGFMGVTQFMAKGTLIGQLYQVLNTGEFLGGGEGERREGGKGKGE
jgi:hypothetical protein